MTIDKQSKAEEPEAIAGTPPKKNPSRKVIPLTQKELYSRKFPKATIKLENYFGSLILNNIEVKLETAGDWNGMPFFYSKLLPLIIPPVDPEETESKAEEELHELKKRFYGG